jgi:hypothetical protein
MTAQDYITRGVVFGRTTDGVLTASGPTGERSLMQALHDDIARRVDGVREMPKPKQRGDETCDACSDALANGRGGWCHLCVLARQSLLVTGNVAWTTTETETNRSPT